MYELMYGLDQKKTLFLGTRETPFLPYPETVKYLRRAQVQLLKQQLIESNHHFQLPQTAITFHAHADHTH